jgi:hypothetical protein
LSTTNIVGLDGKPKKAEPKPQKFTVTLRDPDDSIEVTGFLSYGPAFLTVAKDGDTPLLLVPYERVLKIAV